VVWPCSNGRKLLPETTGISDASEAKCKRIAVSTGCRRERRGLDFLPVEPRSVRRETINTQKPLNTVLATSFP
jgi:hypothetical protein